MMKNQIAHIFAFILVLTFSNHGIANDSNSRTVSLIPDSCKGKNVRVMVVRTALKLDSTSFANCSRIVIKSGGSVYWDVLGSPTTVIIVENGGELTSEEDLFAVVNNGGTVKILDGAINHYHAGSGTTKITSEAEIKTQSGGATVELDNSIAKK